MILSKRWFWLMILGGAILSLGSLWASFRSIALLYTVALIVFSLFDYVVTPSPIRFEILRSIDPLLSLGAEQTVTLDIFNRTKSPITLTLHEEPPIPLAAVWDDTTVTVPASSKSTVEYKIMPKSRGDFTFGDLWVRSHGRLGLIEKQHAFNIETTIKVFPNLKESARFELMARKGLLQQSGIRSRRIMGAGREFESLREYQPDDEFRRIDWKASAKTGKLIARHYEVERSQNVILMIDIGRTMLAEIDGISKLDYAMNAALLLAYVANLSEDRVGLLLFSDKVHQWVPPTKGASQVYKIMNALYNIEASRVESNYRSAIGYLGMQWRRRSLIIDFTDLWDAQSSKQHILELANLQSRHLVACVTIMDTNVLRASEAPIGAIENLFERSVASQVIHSRNLASAELKKRGVLVVDAPADKLSVELVNQYLEVKNRSWL